MNINEFIIRIIILFMFSMVSAIYIYHMYNERKNSMEFSKTCIKFGIIIGKKIEIRRRLNTNIYEFLYFIRVKNSLGDIFTINVSGDDYFKLNNDSTIELEFYKSTIIGIKYGKRGKKL